MQTASQQEVQALEDCLRNGSLSVLGAAAKRAIWAWCGRNKGCAYRERIQALVSVPLLAAGIPGVLDPELRPDSFNLWQCAVDTAQPLLAIMANSLGASETRVARLRELPISLLNHPAMPDLQRMAQAEPWLPAYTHLQTRRHWLAWESLLFSVFRIAAPSSLADWRAIRRTLTPFANQADRMQVFLDSPLLARNSIESRIQTWRVAQLDELKVLLSTEATALRRSYIALRLRGLLIRRIGPDKCLKHFIDRSMEQTNRPDWPAFSKETLSCGARIVVQLKNFQALMEDGAVLRTCLLDRAEHYAAFCNQGQGLFFSLRDADTQRRCSTLQIEVDSENQSLLVLQHSGPENSEPILDCQQAAAILIQTLQANLPVILQQCAQQSANDAEELGSCFNAIPDLARQLPWLMRQANDESAALLLADLNLAEAWSRVDVPADLDGNDLADWINTNGGNWPAWDEAVALEAQLYPDEPFMVCTSRYAKCNFNPDDPLI